MCVLDREDVDTAFIHTLAFMSRVWVWRCVWVCVAAYCIRVHLAHLRAAFASSAVLLVAECELVADDSNAENYR